MSPSTRTSKRERSRASTTWTAAAVAIGRCSQAALPGQEGDLPAGAAPDPGHRAADVAGADDAHALAHQFARVPSKSFVACVPSQNGLFDEPPQRQIDIGSGCSMTRPSGAVRTTGPETM